MKAAEIREAFLSYFEKNGHTRVRSSSLLPSNDPTLFFTNAGMVQFKETFTGEETRAYNRVCSSQKCMRVSGKHNDLENVGHTPRHHTFFEMLGNFSFGDYFKKDAIAYAWRFLTKEMGLDGDRMIATVFEEDDEAEKLWKKHVPKDRIFRLGAKDNFWSMGDTGPCGPCSEILWDFGDGDINAEDFDSDRFMEIWNLVFMQFNRTSGGARENLAAPSIDTGMGLERLTAVMQGVRSNWETDLFVPIINTVAEICKHKPGESDDVDVALRVIADHIRCSVFLIGDGVIPSNEGRGYVLRRILRRAIRYGKRFGQDHPFLTGLIPVVVDEMGSAYPELATHQHFITKVVSAEEERFYQTLDKGLELLHNEFSNAKGKVITGDVAFKLYDTFGFPLDVTQIIAKEHGFKVDDDGFKDNMKEQRDRARASWKGSGEEAISGIYKELSSEGIQSSFSGYSDNTAETSILAILKDGERVKSAKAGESVSFVTNVTPFYGESGGQAGDIGVGIIEGVELEITDTKKPLPDLTVHECKVMKGEITEGMKITIAIDVDARSATRKNHTTTPLLHCALRQVLGEHVKQAGSLVDPTHFRFDFSHFQAMTD
ncbi:MAG: alanine--tRNA ligase, partial [Deltaproteobacteria bacterium]|nr:alanine--tRNA ligase [Deltaproteobacteria bacterium]